MVNYYKSGVDKEGGYSFSRSGNSTRVYPPKVIKHPTLYNLHVPAEKLGDAWNIIVEKMIREKADSFFAEVAAPGKNGDSITFHINDKPNDVKKFKSFLQSIFDILPRRGIPLGVRSSFNLAHNGLLQPGTPDMAPRQPQAKAPQMPSIGQIDWEMAKENPSSKMDILYVMVQDKAKADELQRNLKALGIESNNRTFAKDPVFGKGIRVHVWGDGIAAVRQKQLEEILSWGWGSHDELKRPDSRRGDVQNFSVHTPVRDNAEAQDKISRLKDLGMGGEESVVNGQRTVRLTKGQNIFIPEWLKRNNPGSGAPVRRPPSPGHH